MGCQCSAIDNNDEIKTNINDPIIEVVKSQFQEYSVLIYSKSGCENSQKVRQIFRQNKIMFEYFELDNMSDGNQIINILQKLTAFKSTPFVFIKGKFYGGVKEVQEGIINGDIKKIISV